MPLRDFRCMGCGQEAERFYHASQGADALRCSCCGEPLTMLDLSAGVRGKTGIFPFVSTHFDGTPKTVESLSHLRSLERRYGVCATGFSQDPSNPDSPKDLPEHREGGRAYEGFRFPRYVQEERADGIRRAARAMETGRYRGGRRG